MLATEAAGVGKELLVRLGGMLVRIVLSCIFSDCSLLKVFRNRARQTCQLVINEVGGKQQLNC